MLASKPTKCDHYVLSAHRLDPRLRVSIARCQISSKQLTSTYPALINLQKGRMHRSTQACTIHSETAILIGRVKQLGFVRPLILEPGAVPHPSSRSESVLMKLCSSSLTLPMGAFAARVHARIRTIDRGGSPLSVGTECQRIHSLFVHQVRSSSHKGMPEMKAGYERILV